MFGKNLYIHCRYLEVGKTGDKLLADTCTHQNKSSACIKFYFDVCIARETAIRLSCFPSVSLASFLKKVSFVNDFFFGGGGGFHLFFRVCKRLQRCWHSFSCGQEMLNPKFAAFTALFPRVIVHLLSCTLCSARCSPKLIITARKWEQEASADQCAAICVRIEATLLFRFLSLALPRPNSDESAHFFSGSVIVVQIHCWKIYNFVVFNQKKKKDGVRGGH